MEAAMCKYSKGFPQCVTILTFQQSHQFCRRDSVLLNDSSTKWINSFTVLTIRMTWRSMDNSETGTMMRNEGRYSRSFCAPLSYTATYDIDWKLASAPEGQVHHHTNHAFWDFSCCLHLERRFSRRLPSSTRDSTLGWHALGSSSFQWHGYPIRPNNIGDEYELMVKTKIWIIRFLVNWQGYCICSLRVSARSMVYKKRLQNKINRRDRLRRQKDEQQLPVLVHDICILNEQGSFDCYVLREGSLKKLV